MPMDKDEEGGERNRERGCWEKTPPNTEANSCKKNGANQEAPGRAVYYFPINGDYFP